MVKKKVKKNAVKKTVKKGSRNISEKRVVEKRQFTSKNEEDGLKKVIRWAPRILMIIYTSLLISYGIIQNNKIVLILSLIVLTFLVIGWFWERIGGLTIIALGFIFGIFFDAFKSFNGFMFLVLPLWLIGALFRINGKVNSK